MLDLAKRTVESWMHDCRSEASGRWTKTLHDKKQHKSQRRQRAPCCRCWSPGITTFKDRAGAQVCFPRLHWQAKRWLSTFHRASGWGFWSSPEDRLGIAYWRAPEQRHPRYIARTMYAAKCSTVPTLCKTGISRDPSALCQLWRKMRNFEKIGPAWILCCSLLPCAQQKEGQPSVFARQRAGIIACRWVLSEQRATATANCDFHVIPLAEIE